MGAKAPLLILSDEKPRLRLRLKVNLQVVGEQISSMLFLSFHTAILNRRLYLQEPQKFTNTVLSFVTELDMQK